MLHQKLLNYNLEKHILKLDNMDLTKDKYIIVEIIPDHSNPVYGKICQIQALKLQGLTLIDRFDYRLNKDSIDNIAILKAIDYDNDKFKYVDNTNIMLDNFKTWISNYPLIIIEDSYTLDYLKDINNKKEMIYPYLNLEHSYDVIDNIIKKYNLQPSNHIVDLIYEAIIYESN